MMPIYTYDGARPALAEDVFVAPDADIIGDVTVGPASSIWFKSVLRGDVYPIRLGARTNLQDACVVHVTGGKAATRVGDDVTIGHRVLLHAATVGDRCLIGMGSILLDGAVVGDEVILGAGSLVTPRTVIPPRSLALGRPARVVRPLTDADVKGILESAALYVEYARMYRGGALQEIR